MLVASIVDALRDLPRYFEPIEVFLMGVLSILAAGHVVMYKRDSRAAVYWVGLIFLVPLLGALLYTVFGINRIRRRAALIRSGAIPGARPIQAPANLAELEKQLPEKSRHLYPLRRVVEEMRERPLLPGNRVDPLVNGDAAYPAMLEAIDQARETITLTTYIFDRDEAGYAFVNALAKARERGVQIRILIDATGTRYSWPPILGELRRNKLPFARFLPGFLSGRLPTINLRNHRKILVIDGRTGFTGGMNIRIGHWLSKNPRHPVQDLHFRVEGPVVAQLQEVFANDWVFTTRELLTGKTWFPELQPLGAVQARGIEDGPDEDLDQLRWTILAAISVAKTSIRVMTPYFLPDAPILSALNLAALRGVEVDIVLPEKCNLPFVQWASTAHWWQLLEYGCRIWLAPPPFDHSKLLIVDDGWSLIGSTNWDPRSLRLNFEFNLECYDEPLASVLTGLFESKRSQARRITLEEVDNRSVPIRIRDGVARLFTPLL